MSLGVVVIGRNEGERLRRCLESIKGVAERVVYVDSGSTDGSVAMALGMGLEVIELDMSIPFTAARARNEGSKLLFNLVPDLDYIQFVDGDCELVDGWLEAASAFLDEHKDIAMVCGRLRERYPERSVYNLLCDIEWDTPIGMTKACGGIAMARVTPFKAEGGYRTSLIAGEEPDLCIRLRSSGWKIWRLNAEMALHDAAMTRFGQWWKRTVRTGYAFAEGAHLYGEPPERHWVREARSAAIWGLLIPFMIVASCTYVGTWGLAILLIYPAQITRLALRGTRSAKENWWRALFLVLAKFPEMVGQFKFLYTRLKGKPAHLIEYK